MQITTGTRLSFAVSFIYILAGMRWLMERYTSLRVDCPGTVLLLIFSSITALLLAWTVIVEIVDQYSPQASQPRSR